MVGAVGPVVAEDGVVDAALAVRAEELSTVRTGAQQRRRSVRRAVALVAPVHTVYIFQIISQSFD